jgi:hypothetical protein
MDPYLEGHLWTSFHAFLATAIARQLAPRLRPKYIALPERRYTSGVMQEVMVGARSMIPDVTVRKTGARSLPTGAPVAVADNPLKLRSGAPTRIPHFHIFIRDVKKRRLVTAIELLSPTNKGSGRAAYLRKRRRFLQSSVHLLEIDLHHQGRRVPLLQPYPAGAYFVLLNRATKKRSWTDVWPAALQDPLPTVQVPLLKGDPDVPLDLQEAFTRVYDEGSLDLAVEYDEPPDVELSAEELTWIDERLREAGLP